MVGTLTYPSKSAAEVALPLPRRPRLAEAPRPHRPVRHGAADAVGRVVELPGLGQARVVVAAGLHLGGREHRVAGDGAGLVGLEGGRVEKRPTLPRPDPEARRRGLLDHAPAPGPPDPPHLEL